MPLRFFTKKIPSKDWREESELRQCLSLFDLTMIGIGSVVGSGLFVVTGLLARNVAGPALIIAFMIAAIPTLIMGLCYAEFASRVPNVGASYLYTQVSLGEIWAFIVGWNYFVSSIASGAAIARSSSEYTNSMLGGYVYKFLSSHLAYGNVKGLAKFPDFLAVAILILVLIFVVLGAWHSSAFIKLVTCVKILVILFMMVVGIYFAHPENWSTLEKFAPYGITGVFAASAQCIYAFGGIDVVAMASEESSDRKDPPRAIYLTLIVSISIYVTISALLTLMVPYSSLSEYAPLADAYGKWAFSGAQYIVSIGALCATLSALLVTCFAAARVVYAMASDGLLPAFLGNINQSRQVPVRAAVFCGVLITIVTLIMDLDQLIQLMSTTILTTSMLVLSGVILTRYQPGIQSVKLPAVTNSGRSCSEKLSRKLCPCISAIHAGNTKETTEYQSIPEVFSSVTESDEDEDLFQLKSSEPNESTNLIANVCVMCIITFLIVFCILLNHGWVNLKRYEVWAVLSTLFLVVLILISLITLYRQPRNHAVFPFMVPCVPAVPLLSLVVDVILLVNLSLWTYIRFLICSMIGLSIYLCFTYPWTESNSCSSETKLKSSNEP